MVQYTIIIRHGNRKDEMMEGIRPKGAAEFDGYIMPEPVKEVTPETIARRTELHRLLLQTVAEVKEQIGRAHV